MLNSFMVLTVHSHRLRNKVQPKQGREVVEEGVCHDFASRIRELRGRDINYANRIIHSNSGDELCCPSRHWVVGSLSSAQHKASRARPSDT